MVNKVLVAAGLLGFSAIALGAYGDHGLRGSVDAETMRSFETAIRYQLFHALALLAIGIGIAAGTAPASTLKRLTWTGWVMLAGTLVFCGSIYLKIIFGVDSATKLAPLGGMTLMAGWLMLVFAGIKKSV